MSDLPGFHMLEGGKRKDGSVVEDSRMRRFMIILSTLLILSPAAGVKANPIEIGAVQWGRDLSKALRMSAETGRPVFVLFQEVPGCSGCQDFGRTVLTNPLVVEAVEDEFLPILVFNNRGGEDRRLLDRFGEPAWNFQVVRFLDAQGERYYSTKGSCLDRSRHRDTHDCRSAGGEAAGSQIPSGARGRER